MNTEMLQITPTPTDPMSSFSVRITIALSRGRRATAIGRMMRGGRRLQRAVRLRILPRELQVNGGSRVPSAQASSLAPRSPKLGDGSTDEPVRPW